MLGRIKEWDKKVVNAKIGWNIVTFNDLWVHTYLNENISIHINFYQNRFINECVREKKKKLQKRGTKMDELLWPSMTFEVINVFAYS